MKKKSHYCVSTMKEEKLLELLQKKKGFFEAILDLTETEEHLPIDQWLPTLKQKKVLLSCIEEIDSQLLPYRSRLQDLTQEISEELQEIRQLVKHILDRDAQNQDRRKRDLAP